MKVKDLFGAIVVFCAVCLISLNGVWQSVMAQAPLPTPPTVPNAVPSAVPNTAPIATPSAVPGASPTDDPNAPLTGSPIDPIPGSRTDPPAPSPSATPTALPTPAPTLMPSVIIPNNAEALPMEGEHVDKVGRFRIGLLKGYRVTNLGDSVLMESPDGRLAYTVLAQTAGQLGLLSGSVTVENLAQIARNALQRGEAFQADAPQSIVNGIQMNWTGQLTIGGKAQPVNGIILAKPGNNSVLLLTIAATETGAADLPGAIAALGDSLQGL
jgi:hypothetical protein